MLTTLFKRYATAYPIGVALLLISSVVQVLSNLFLPALNGRLIDDGVARGDLSVVWSVGTVMLVVALFTLLASVVAIVSGAYVSMSVAREMRRDFFRTVMSFGHQETALFGTSSLVTRSTNDVRQVQQFLTMALSIMLVAPILALGGLFMAFVQSFRLSWVIVATVVVLAVVMTVMVRRMVPSFRSMQERLDAMGSVLSQQLAGVRVVRAFVKEQAEEERFARTNRDMTHAYLTVGRYFVTLFPAVMLLINVGSAAVVWFGAGQVAAGNSNVGTVIAFIQYLMLIMMGVLMFAFMSMMVPRAEVAAGRVLEVMDTPVGLDRSSGTVTELPAPGTFEFDHVTFTYPGAAKPVLSEVSVRAQRGQSIAIIGATGSGKSTFVKLLLRLLEPQSGTVRVAGVPVAQIARSTLAKQFGYVSQQPHVFGATIGQNLRIGNPRATDEELWEALDIAQASEFIPDEGLDFVVQQGGKNLSGGQRQRLAIAMAVARHTPFLVFDDSFSALDTATDKALRARLDQLDVTRVIVTQRVASAHTADTIVVLDDGHVVASGTHAELLNSCDLYQEIVESQVTVGSQS